MKKHIMKIFIVFLLIILTIFGASIITEPKLISKMENRKLNQYPFFRINNFLDGRFQNDLEDAIADQIFMSRKIKANYTKIKNSLVRVNVRSLAIINSSVCDGYTAVGSEYYNYKCDDYIFSKPKKINYYGKRRSNFISNYNDIFSDFSVYYYYVSTPRSSNFTDNSFNEDMITQLSDRLKSRNFAYLKYNNYESLKKYFYKTDHHWNHLGSYKGYTDIVEMILKGDEKPLKPLSVKNYNIKFNGSANKRVMNDNIHDEFITHKFNLQSHEVQVNRVKRPYGNIYSYDNGENSNGKYFNHYAGYYGGDVAEIIMDYNNSSRDNLLVLASSFSNPVNELIASHFNKTFIIDLRHYERTFKESFNPKEYINNNNIDKVLVIGDIDYYTSDRFLIKDDK